MGEMLQELTTESVGRAFDECNIVYHTFFDFAETQIHNESDIWWYETGIESDHFNGVIQAHLSVETMEAEIARVFGHFRERRLPFIWYVGPASSPANLGERLLAQGLLYEEMEPVMGLDIAKMNEGIEFSTKLVIVPVTNQTLLRQWIEVWLCGAPPEIVGPMYEQYARLKITGEEKRRFYLGLLDGMPVATGALCLGAGAVEVGHIVTVHQVRRQGLGAAMTLAVLREAREMGYKVAVLTASPMGLEIYRRIGFQEYGEMNVYWWRPEGGDEGDG